IAGYLLGKLNEADQNRIDEELGEPEFYERVTTVEDRLIDDYAQGRLSGADSELFEKHLLRTSRQRERVRLARVFFGVVNEINEEKEQPPIVSRQTSTDRETARSWWQSLLDYVRVSNLIPASAMAAAALVMLAGGAWMIWKAFEM